ncbi:MAG: hypothetical protein AB7F35_00385 [Acetobacteraceae bacterium]
MDSISGISTSTSGAAPGVQPEQGLAKRIDGDHGRDRSAETTAEVNKADQKDKQQTRALDMEA